MPIERDAENTRAMQIDACKGCCKVYETRWSADNNDTEAGECWPVHLRGENFRTTCSPSWIFILDAACLRVERHGSCWLIFSFLHPGMYDTELLQASRLPTINNRPLTTENDLHPLES